MERFLAELVRRGLVGAIPLIAACSCPDRTILRSPASIGNVAESAQPTAEECKQLCGEYVKSCKRVPFMDKPANNFSVDVTGYTISCTLPNSCPGGRRPAGLDDGAIVEAGAGAHFAELARLEAASVVAFVELSRELALHGAPRVLVERAWRAAVEEIEHARIAGALACLHGAVPIAPIVAPTPPRALEVVLADNANEGLVHERYGAALAAVRAIRATSPAIRDAMHVIALDEASHAGLSEDIHAWGVPRVSRAARARLREAHERARHDLRDALDVEPSRELAATGVPSATLAIEVFDAA